MQVRKEEDRGEEGDHMKEAEDFFDFDDANFNEHNKETRNDNQKEEDFFF